MKNGLCSTDFPMLLSCLLLRDMSMTKVGFDCWLWGLHYACPMDARSRIFYATIETPQTLSPNVTFGCALIIFAKANSVHPQILDSGPS